MQEWIAHLRTALPDLQTIRTKERPEDRHRYLILDYQSGLVADKDMEFALKGLLARPQALGIRQITYDLFVHNRRDPGCLNEAAHFLRRFLHNHQYALVLFDVAHKPYSADIYYELATRVSLKRQTEPAFQRLLQALHTWSGA
jgi:hypothetical protein